MPTEPLDLGWRGDPCDLIAEALDSTAGRDRLAHFIAAAEQPWFADAACRRPENRGVEFFPSRGESAQPALQLCGRCPALVQCRAWALDQPDHGHGVIGGMTARQRHAMRGET